MRLVDLHSKTIHRTLMTHSDASVCLMPPTLYQKLSCQYRLSRQHETAETGPGIGIRGAQKPRGSQCTHHLTNEAIVSQRRGSTSRLQQDGLLMFEVVVRERGLRLSPEVSKSGSPN